MASTDKALKDIEAEIADLKDLLDIYDGGLIPSTVVAPSILKGSSTVLTGTGIGSLSPIATTTLPLSASALVEPPTMDPNNVLKWSTKALDNLFGTNWEESQLYGVLSDLDMLESAYGYVAGGSMVRHFMKTEIFKGDIDIFPNNSGGLNSLVKKFTAEGYKLEKKKFSYSFEYRKGVRKTKVQIVHRNPQYLSKTLSEFDFEHVRVAYHQGAFRATMGAPVALAQRQLHLRHVREPNYTLLRALKYKGLGFSADKAIHQLAVMINRGEKNINAAEWEEKNPIVEY